jgi:hypothetical protein
MTFFQRLPAGAHAPPRAPRRRRLIVAGAVAAVMLAVLPGPAWSLDTNQDIVVHVQRDGPHVAVDVDCPVDAPWPIVWEVLTDYDRMAEFVLNLEHSGVTDRVDNVLRVHQSGRVSRGPMTMAFDNVREVVLVPFREIRSRLISGDLKASNFVTRIVEVDSRIHIVNSGRYTPNIWVPPVIGPLLIEEETRKQYGQIRTEILRRSALPRPPT